MEGREAGFNVEKIGGRRSKATRDYPTACPMGNLQLHKMGGKTKGEPTRGSVSEDGQKKGSIERS